MVSTGVSALNGTTLSRVRVLSGASSLSLRHNRIQSYSAEKDAVQHCPPAVHISTEDISHSLGFTASQKTAFQNGCVDGESVVMLNAEVARSLGINSRSSDTSSDDSPALPHSVHHSLGLDESFEDSADQGEVKVEHDGEHDYRAVLEDSLVDHGHAVNISVSEVDSDCLMDPDGFLEAELASGKSEVVVDQDLTSLSWLQSRNLLKDIRVRPAVKTSTSCSRLHDAESSSAPARSSSPCTVLPDRRLPPHSSHQPAAAANPNTRDILADKSVKWRDKRSDEPAPSRRWGSVRGSAGSQRASSGLPTSRMKRPPPYMSYNPRVDVTFKPPFSFSCLIFMAIEDSAVKALPVKEIYTWIMRSFPFYNNMCVGWKNSVRHNLSLNKCFYKVDSGRCSGKGSYWSVDPIYRPTLLYTLRRSRCVTEMPLSVDGHRLPWASALQSSPPTQFPLAPAHSLQLCSSDSRCPGKPRAAEHDERFAAKFGSGAQTISNPELFPFLARRLRTDSEHPEEQQLRPGRHHVASHEKPRTGGGGTDKTERDAHLKGFPHHLSNQSRGKGGRDFGGEPRSEKHRSDRFNMRLVVIRHYPADEHTYAGGGYCSPDNPSESVPLEPHMARPAKLRFKRRKFVSRGEVGREVDVITDGAAVDGIAPVSAATVAASARALEAAEASRRLVEEGADLLLNLAGMSRSQSPLVAADSSSPSGCHAEPISSHASSV